MVNEMRARLKVKLQWKIFMFLLAFCGLLLMILWLFQMVFLESMYEMIRQNEIENAVVEVREAINSSELESVLYKLQIEDDILVTLEEDFIPLSLPNKDREPKDKVKTITRHESFILTNGKKLNLVFHATITPVDATVKTLQIQLYIVTGIMIVLAVGIAYLIARRIAKPIVRINENAKRLAQADYTVIFKEESFLEIKELANTLNITTIELSKNENLRRELMANISHDLRTPLALMYSYAEMMHDFPDEITPDQTKTIMDEAAWLSSLVNDIMDVSKLESGTIQLNKQAYDFTDSLSKTVERLNELVKKDGYQLVFDYDEVIEIIADEVKITQAFYNLLMNAIHYCGKDKTVHIKQIREKETIRIEVSDKGPGIKEVDLPYIWDRYYKVSKTHKRSMMGTGLGLSIVKTIIKMHEGTYGVSSKIGKGSTFWFTLKRA